MTTNIIKPYPFATELPPLDIPCRGKNLELDTALEAVQEEAFALERGDLSSFHPSKLKPLISHLKNAIKKVRSEKIGMNALNHHLVDLMAIENTIESYMTIAKKVIESHKKKGEARQIQNFLRLVKKIGPLEDFQSPGLVSEFYDAIRHPIQTLLPSEKQQKIHLKERFFNKARSIVSFLEKFEATAKSDLAGISALEREAVRIESSDSAALTGMGEGRKRVWNGIFSLLQLGSQAIQSYRKESMRTLLQREIARNPKPQLTKAQEREVAFVGLCTGDKLESLRSKNDQEFIRFTKKFPNTRSFLQTYRTSTSPLDPNEVMNQYRAKLHPITLFGNWPNPVPTPASTQVQPDPVPAQNTDLAQWIGSPPLPVNDRLLAHFLGENFARDSGLEGYNSRLMKQFIANAMIQRREIDKNPQQYDGILHQLSVADKLDIALDQGPAKLLEAFQLEGSRLKNGESFFLHGGWTKHAVAFEVRKQENNLFTFRIYNNGQGAQYHQKGMLDHQVHLARFRDIQDVPFERIASLPFCKALYVQEKETAPFGKWDGSEMYEGVAFHLGGEVSEELSIDKLSKQVQSGFCTYLSLNYWMREFDPRLTERFEIELQTKSFSDFSKIADLSLERNRKLIQKSGAVLARKAESAFEKKVINEKEWELIQQEISKVRIDESTMSQSFSLESSPFQTQVDLPNLTTVTEKENLAGKELDLFLDIAIDFQPSTFLSEAISLRTRLAKANENQNYELVKEVVLEWIENIPFSRRDELIVSLKPEESEALLRQLAEIGKDYLFASIGTASSEKPSILPRAALALTKLLTLGHALSTQSLPLPNLYQKNMDLLLEGKSGSTHLFDPRLEDQLQEIRDYWREVEPVEKRTKLSFFGFESLTSGSSNPYRDYRVLFEKESEEVRYSREHEFTSIRWPDLLWIQEYIKKPEIQAQIAFDPELANKPPIVQALILQSNQRPSLLPRAYTDLFELSYVLDIAMGNFDAMPNSKFGTTIDSAEREKGIQTFYRSRTGFHQHDQDSACATHTEWTTGRTAFTRNLISSLPWHEPISRSESFLPILDRNYALEQTQDVLDNEPLYRTKKQVRNYKGDYLSTSSHFRNRLTPSERVREFPELGKRGYPDPRRQALVLEMPLQEMREKLALSGDPALQIRETSAYYQKNPQLLENREDQVLFKKLFFEPPLLLEFLRSHPKEAAKFISRFKEFCQKGVKLYTQLGNPRVAAFHLELADKFQKYLIHQAPESIDLDAREINPARELRALIDKNIHSPQDEAFLYLDLILMQDASTLNSEGAIDLIEASMRLETVSWPEKTKLDSGFIVGAPEYPHEKEALAKKHLLKLRSPLEQLLCGPRRNEILNGVMQRLCPTFQSTEWAPSPKFPYFASDDHSIHMDLFNGKLHQKGGQIKPLPREMLDHFEIRHLFELNEKPLAFEIDKNTYEFSTQRGQKIRVHSESWRYSIQKEIEGRFAQKISPLDSLPQALKEIQGHWLSIDRPRVLWIGDNIQATLTDSKINEVHRTDTGWRLGDPQTPKSSPLFKIEDPSHILPWIDPQTGKMAELALPRLSLTFKFDEEGNAISTRFDGYRIAPDQSIPALGDLNHYLTLENGKKKLILMQAQRRAVQKEKGLQTEGPFPLATAAPLAAFDVDSNGHLVPKDDDSRLYLSYLLTTEQRYDEALESLVGTDSEIRPLSNLETEILTWMAESPEESPDSTPIPQDPDSRAAALRLKAQHLLIRRLENNLAKIPEKVLTDSHYANILQNWNEVPPRFLPSVEEEARLQRYLGRSRKPQILSRRGNGGPLQLQHSQKSANNDQQARERLNDVYHLFRGSVKKTHHFLRASGWTRDFILKIYECAQSPTKELLNEVYDHFFPGSTSKPMRNRTQAEEMREIRDSLAMIASSDSEFEERATAAMLAAVFDHRKEFPKHGELKSHLSTKDEDEKYNNAYENKRYGRRQQTSQFNVWARENLFPLIRAYAPSFLEKTEYPPIEFLPSKESAPASLWKGESTRLSSSLTIPDVHLESLFSLETSTPYETAHKTLTETFSHDEEMRQDLITFASSLKASPRRYSFKEPQLLQRLEESTRTSAIAARRQEEELEIHLLKEANLLHSNAVPRLRQVGGYLSDFERPIEMPELLKRFLTLDTAALHKRNSALTQDQCHALFRKTEQFLEVATQRQHLERLSKKCAQVRHAKGDEKELLIQELVADGGQKRAYSPTQHPEYLLMEYANNIRLRKAQVDVIENLTPGTAQEMIMGSGKTMVLSPLLALKAADGENLSMLVMPHELLPDMVKAMESTLGTAFGHSIDVFSFNRETNLDDSNLRRIYERLIKAVNERRVVAISGSSLQSFFLMAVDSFAQKSPESAEYRKILSLMKQSGHLILDEIHLMLDVLHAHHFSIGERTALSSFETDGAIRLIQILANRGWEAGKQIGTADYEMNWKEWVVDEVLKAEEFAPLSKGALKSYLLEDGNPQCALYVDRIKSRGIQNTLATLKEQINRVLPLTLSRQIGEHFGELPHGADSKGASRKMAIPYRSSQNPAIGSQFGSDLETIDYTILLHSAKGVDAEVVEKELNFLKKKIVDELDELRTKELEKAPTYHRFLDLAGSAKYPIFSLKPKEIEEIRQRINQNTKHKLELIRSWILPELRAFPRQLFTNGHVFPLLVSKIRGFSGTNWNSKTFPKAFERQFASDTREYTLHLLQSKQPVVSLPKQPQELLEKGQSLADRGGIFRQMNNREVAHSLLENSSAKGVVYYKGDDRVVFARNQNEPIPMENCPFEKEDLIAFWDQRHTTGSDIKLGASAKAIVTISRHTHMYELLQTVWRMRGLAHGQQIEFAIEEEEDSYIRNSLYREMGRSPDAPLETKDLFLYCQLKEKTRGKEHSERALGFKLKGEIIEEVINQLCDNSMPLPEKEVFDELFYKEKPRDPYELYGQIVRPIPKEQAVQAQVERILSSPALHKLPLKTQARIGERVKSIAAAELPHLPDFISSMSSEYETEVQIQTQIDQKTDIKTEMKVEVSVKQGYYRDYPAYGSRGIVSWDGPLSRENFLPSPAGALRALTLPHKKFFNPSDFPFAPVVSVGEALGTYGFSAPFDSMLTASATFFPLQEESPTENTPSRGVYPYGPFGQYQDIVQEALLIQDLRTGQIQMMLINQNEAKQFEERLTKERGELEKGCRLALYHVDYGLYSEGEGFPSEETLHTNTQFMRLKTQAKFFNGDVHYSKDELIALESWFTELQKQGALLKVKHLFEMQILSHREKSSLGYPRSPLQKLFHKVSKTLIPLLEILQNQLFESFNRMFFNVEPAK